MAEFNPFLPQPNIPDWTNAPGRLIDGSGIGEIFGDLAVNVATTYKDQKDKRVTNELYDAADSMIEKARVETLSEAAGIPKDVANAMNRAELYKKAFESGKYSDAAFYNKIGVWSKEMRVKYPQYKDVIDQQLTRVMGRTPANLEMGSVRSEMEAQQTARSEAASKNQTFLSQHAEFLSPEETIKIQNGDPSSEALKTKAILLKGDKARLEHEWKILEQTAKAGALEAGPVLSQTVANIQRAFYLGAIDKGGGTLQKLRQTISDMREGGFTPEETAAAEQMIAEAKVSLEQQWIAATTTPGENGKALADYFSSDPTAWNAQKGKIDEMIGSLDGLLTGKSGIFEWNATMEAAAVNGRAAKLREQFGAEAYDGYKAIVDLVGQDQANLVYGNIATTEGVDPVTTAMTQLVFGKAIKSGNIGTAVEELTKGVDPSLLPAFNKGARAGVEAMALTAFDTKLPLEARTKAFTTLISDTENKFMRQLKDTPDNTGRSSREKYFLRMTSADMEKTAKELGLEKEYTAWIKNTSPALMATVIEEINATNVNTKYVDIKVNPNTLQAEVSLNKSLVKDPAKLTKWLQQARTGRPMSISDVPGGIPIQDLEQLKVGLDAVQKLNMINGALAKALKSEQPGMSNEDLAKALTQYMADLQATYTKAEPWTKQLYESFKNIDWLGTKAQEEWKKSKTGEDFGAVPTGDVDFNMLEGGTATSTVGTTPDTGDETANSVLAFIHGAEGADYNTVFGGGKVDAAGMTVADVLARTENAGSSAFGAVQVMKDTLKGLVKNGVVTPEDVMNQATQDKIGMALLKEAGYDDWKAGKISDGAFADKLAGIWASLPLKGGKSKYDGVGSNKATVKRADVLALLEDLR